MEKMAITVVLVLLFAALMTDTAIADSGGFQSPPRLSFTDTGRISVSWELLNAGPGQLYWRQMPDDPTYSHIEETGISLKHHTFQFPELVPDDSYQYKAVSGSYESEEYIFYPPPQTRDTVRIVAYGQTGDNDLIHRELCSDMYHKRPSFVLQGGGIVEDPDSMPLWKGFWGASAGLAGRVPYMCAAGPEWGAEWENSFEFPGDQSYYSFEVANVSVIVLNTNLEYRADEPQYTWLLDQLRLVPEGNWKIVVMHRAPFSTGPNGSDFAAQLYLVPIFEVYGVDLVISSSDNSYQRIVKNGVNYIVTGGGGAGLTSVGTMSGTAYSESYHHYVMIEICDFGMRLTATRSDATLMETFEMTTMSAPEKPEQVSVEMEAMPNPFNAACRIDVNIPSGVSEWDFYITDMNGRKIDKGWSFEQMGSDRLVINWDAGDMPTGVYMANFRTEENLTSRKIILSK